MHRVTAVLIGVIVTACAPNLSHQVATNTADIAECRRLATSNGDKLGLIAGEVGRLSDEKKALEAEVERLNAELAQLGKRVETQRDLLDKVLDSFKTVLARQR